MTATPSSMATSGRRGGWNVVGFDTQLLLVTLAPWFVYLAAYLSGIDFQPLTLVALLLSSPHVLATFGLYIDPGLRDVIRSHRVRYFAIPGCVLLLSIAIFTLASGRVTLYLITGFLLWQTHHFTKQNLGVASFWLKVRGMTGLTTSDRRLIRATAVIGVLGILRAVEIVPQADHFLRIAECAAVVVGLFLALDLNDPRRTLLFVCVVMFISPTVVFQSNIVAMAAVYAAAHGAQYYLMVGRTIATKRSVVRATVPFVLIGSIAILYLGSRSPYTSVAWMYGLAKGIVAWHFIADARLWRMSDPEIRGFLKSRFSFL